MTAKRSADEARFVVNHDYVNVWAEESVAGKSRKIRTLRKGQTVTEADLAFADVDRLCTVRPGAKVAALSLVVSEDEPQTEPAEPADPGAGDGAGGTEPPKPGPPAP